jgi:quercetin 2,3-dioxygenase
MMHVRKANERGGTNIDWLESYHSFSFGHYYDPKYTGFGNLVVINDDIIKGGGGFGEHGHSNMEIVTYVIDGELAHRDSIGNVATIKSGEVQRMSAGTGIRHSEFNASKTNPVRLLQVWFTPANEGDKPSYEQKYFSRDDKRNKLKLVVSSKGKDGAVDIHQDIDILASVLEEGKALNYNLGKRYAWLQVADGTIEVNGKKLENGDGLAVEDEKELSIKGIGKESEFVIFSMGR